MVVVPALQNDVIAVYTACANQIDGGAI